jgi:hypothetical protein
MSSTHINEHEASASIRVGVPMIRSILSSPKLTVISKLAEGANGA